jgi:arylsulfatase A-like enzyme
VSKRKSGLFDKGLTEAADPQKRYYRSTHPNIILIVGDDVGYEIPTCDGGQSYQTPNLDRMAAQGRRYTQCHASPVVCTFENGSSHRKI